MSEPVETDAAASNDNPYSQGIVADDTVSVSGFEPEDPEIGEAVEGDVARFGEHSPARVCVEVSRLPADAAVEMDAIARIDCGRVDGSGGAFRSVRVGDSADTSRKLIVTTGYAIIDHD